MPKLAPVGNIKRTVSLERSVLYQIRADLGRERDLVLWRNGIAGVEEWSPTTGQVRHQHAGLPTGSSDLVGILRVNTSTGYIGRFFGLEVKRPGEKPEPHQVEWLALVRLFGGFAAVAHSVEEARAALGRARCGRDQ